jgi:hypothetical protein
MMECFSGIFTNPVGQCNPEDEFDQLPERINKKKVDEYPKNHNALNPVSGAEVCP